MRLFSKSGADPRPLGAQHLHLQPQNFQGGRSVVQARGVVDHGQQRGVLLAGHAHHLHLPNEVRLLPAGHAGEIANPGKAIFLEASVHSQNPHTFLFWPLRDKSGFGLSELTYQ